MHLHLVIAGLLLAGVAQAAPPPPLSPIERCAVNTPESREAHTALDALGKKIEALPPEQSPQPLYKELTALLQTRCFLIARDELPYEFTSGLALTTWWRDGGRDWLKTTLGDDRVFVLPPTTRATLALNDKAQQPLAQLLCRLQDPLCGRETGGWVRRLEEALEQRLDETEERLEKSQEPSDDDSPRTEAHCAARAQKEPAAQRYAIWKACITTIRPLVEALPLGRVRAPTRGFFVIHGRRGHYGFCDEVRIYDLGSGAAYVAQSCTKLALLQDGAVDAKSTDDSRRPQLVTGHVSIDNLREAVWLTLLLKHVERSEHVKSYRARIPAGIEPQLPRKGGAPGGGYYGSGAGSTSNTELDWLWIDGEKVQAKGQITWPSPSSTIAAHAIELLQVFEAGLQPGCVTDAVPNLRRLSGATPGVNRRDAPDSLDPIYHQLWDSIARAPRCAAPSK